MAISIRTDIAGPMALTDLFHPIRASVLPEMYILTI